MTTPRHVAPCQFYLVSRRCSERRFFLRPDDETNSIFEYCLAEAASRFGVHVVAWLAMSNHYHAVIEDPFGMVPQFLEHFHKMTARSLNAKWGRTENLWAAEPPSAVRLVELADVLEKVLYTLVNPVVDQLVERALDWPGANSVAALDGREITLKRPLSFFKKKSRVMPEKVVLEARCPAGWPGGADAWVEAVRRGIAEREKAARLRRDASRSAIVGRKAVLAAAPTARPATAEPRGTLRPHLACGDPSKRVVELLALRTFRAAYAAARERLIAGMEAIFPYGTYKLAREFGVASSPAPS